MRLLVGGTARRRLKSGEHLAQVIYQFDGTRWRQCQPCADVNLRFGPFWGAAFGSLRNEAHDAQGDAQGTPVEHRADELVGVEFLDRWIINNPQALWLFGHS